MTTTYTLVKGAKTETRELGGDDGLAQRASQDHAACQIVRNASKRRLVILRSVCHCAVDICEVPKTDPNFATTAMACLESKAQRNQNQDFPLYQLARVLECSV